MGIADDHMKGLVTEDFLDAQDIVLNGAEFISQVYYILWILLDRWKSQQKCSLVQHYYQKRWCYTKNGFV